MSKFSEPISLLTRRIRKNRKPCK